LSRSGFLCSDDPVDGSDSDAEFVSDLHLGFPFTDYAWADRQHLDSPYASLIICLEDEASAKRFGLWVHSNPQLPLEVQEVIEEGQTSVLQEMSCH